MRILVVCQRYWPEQFQVTLVCEELAARGHEVTVLCGLPNVGLPFGEPGHVPAEYRSGRNREQEHNGVRILRSFEIGRRTGVLWRALNYYSFWKSAERDIMRIRWGFDVVLAYQLSPAMMAVPAVEYASRTGTPVFLYCCDLWPESMRAMLGNRGELLLKHFGRICRRMYQGVDRIGIQSPGFEGYFREVHGIDASRLVYFPHFATDVTRDGIRPLAENHDGTNLVFMGNMGVVQGVDWMVEAVSLLPRALNATLHFVGDGSELKKAIARAKELGVEDRVIFHGRQPTEDMPTYYAMADVCLLALDDSSAIGLTIPSKLQGYMAAGKPVVGAVGGGARFVIEDSGCGIAVPPRDIRAMAEAIRILASDRDKRDECGKRARSYYEKHFTRAAYVNRLEAELVRLAKEGRPHDRQE